MSTATLESTAGPTRSQRLVDLLFSSGAIPLPIDLPVPALPLEDSKAIDALAIDYDKMAAAPEFVIQNPIHQPANIVTSGTAEPSVLDDALLKSLQASVEAIHSSLKQNPDAPHSDLSQVPTDQSQTEETSDIAALGDPSTLLANHSSSLASMGSGDGNATSPNVGPDTQAGLSHLLSTTLQPLNQVLPEVTGLADEALHLVQAVEATVDNLLNDLGSTLGGVLNVVSAGPAGLTTVTAPLIETVTHTLGAVTIPSLEGLGFDALAGLLPPAAASPTETHGANPIPTFLEDIPGLAAFDIPEIVHADQNHSLLHLVGHGLI
jgi:hypothetical protein